MNTYIGIDIGTSGVKLLLVTKEGKILSQITETYSVFYPQDGWSEQNPEDWVEAVKKGLTSLFSSGEYLRSDVKGISFGGQMHGLVLLDEEDRVIRPAILWNDGRTQKQVDYLNETIGKERLADFTANIAFAGFTAPKILWVKENEPWNFAKISKIFLPKDYVAYKISGVFSTDPSDASGTLLFDVQNKRWSEEMLRVCSVKKEWLPKVYESYEPIGRVRDEYGFKNAVVVAGAGDNAAAAVGTGTVENGGCNISLGTSGTIFIANDNFLMDKRNGLHSFVHATGKWHVMGCILSAASANQWWVENVLGVDYEKAISEMENILGENETYFLPYLMGERSPHNDVNARGVFLGMRPDTTRERMSLAVLEGVAFALKDCLEIVKTFELQITSTNICGGGAKSSLWKKIIANVLNVEVRSLETEQGPAYGAAILAMVGAGEYASVECATKKIVKYKDAISPDLAIVEKYEKKYEIFKRIYVSLKDVFKKMST